MRIFIMEDEYVGLSKDTLHNKAQVYALRLIRAGHDVFVFDGSNVVRHIGDGTTVIERSWQPKASVSDVSEWFYKHFKREERVGVLVDFQIREDKEFGAGLWVALNEHPKATYELFGVVLSKLVGAVNRSRYAAALGIPAERIYDRLRSSPDDIAKAFGDGSP